ncbi:MAG: beta-ketoacyl-[acyl-carrier-protein] synthase family protein [Armatimonadetes bacterium]|nr:beta-ketoacyl-[acyl-carrier-protein] synthase family protein [Armatimonadota bacterium]
MRRVVVTGLGVICSVGHDVPQLLAALTEGRSGTATIASLDPSWLNTQVGAEVRNASFDHVVPRPEQRHLDRQSLLAIHAAQQAVDDAGFTSAEDGPRCGVILGTGMGPVETIDGAIREVHIDKRKPRPTTIPRCMFNAASGQLSIRFGCKGPSQTIVTACASSAHALGQAANFIRHGTADAFLAGGTEVFPTLSLLAAWDTLRVMSTSNDRPEAASRPFNRDRDGFVMGEGSAVLVLESEERATARGARIYGEIIGVGLSSDAHHITQPQVGGLVQAMSLALADAQVAPEDVQYINAHGTATPINDPLETEAIKQVYGDHARRLMVSSTKSAHGHTIGAAGALEATATLLGMNHGFVPATLNLTDPDPACDLDCVPLTPRAERFDVAMSNSFAFGGHNVSLVFRRY